MGPAVQVFGARFPSLHECCHASTTFICSAKAWCYNHLSGFRWWQWWIWWRKVNLFLAFCYSGSCSGSHFKIPFCAFVYYYFLALKQLHLGIRELESRPAFWKRRQLPVTCSVVMLMNWRRVSTHGLIRWVVIIVWILSLGLGINIEFKF